jgi:hypothetical protein
MLYTIIYSRADYVVSNRLPLNGKTGENIDENSWKTKRRNLKTINETMQGMIKRHILNDVKIKYIPVGFWYSSADNMRLNAMKKPFIFGFESCLSGLR